jgi:hypothetical protein
MCVNSVYGTYEALRSVGTLWLPENVLSDSIIHAK